VVLVGLMAVASFAGMGAVRRAVVNEVDLTKVADGSYKGAFGAGRFQFAVTVSVKDHRIEAVDLVDASKATDMTRAISAAIVEKQKVALDAVSGASLTTRAFTKAVQNALAP
jgi:uncharacterized protein with FMN-binding domain